MSLLAVACKTGAGTFRQLLWEPFALVTQLAHAAQVRDGATMRWLRADQQDVAETFYLISNLCNHST